MSITGYKRCSHCKHVRRNDEFNRSSRSSDGLRSWCRVCDHAYDRKRNPEVNNERRRKRVADRRDALLAEQGGVCAICGTDDPGVWCLDHDHDHCATISARDTCGKCDRGVLCRYCNLALVSVERNPLWGEKARRYLGLHENVG